MRLGRNVNDLKLAHGILTDDNVLPYIVDDGFTDEDRAIMVIKLLSNKDIYILNPSINSIFVFIPRNLITYDGHVSILPAGRGKAGVKDEKNAISWMFDNTRCQKVIGYTPAQYRHVIRFHILCGFKHEGYSKDSFLKNGKLFDEVILGITKKEWKGK